MAEKGTYLWFKRKKSKFIRKVGRGNSLPLSNTHIKGSLEIFSLEGLVFMCVKLPSIKKKKKKDCAYKIVVIFLY